MTAPLKKISAAWQEKCFLVDVIVYREKHTVTKL
jgi:hypothetical protein